MRFQKQRLVKCKKAQLLKPTEDNLSQETWTVDKKAKQEVRN